MFSSEVLLVLALSFQGALGLTQQKAQSVANDLTQRLAGASMVCLFVEKTLFC
jgi:hypothetical protein